MAATPASLCFQTPTGQFSGRAEKGSSLAGSESAPRPQGARISALRRVLSGLNQLLQLPLAGVHCASLHLHREEARERA